MKQIVAALTAMMLLSALVSCSKEGSIETGTGPGAGTGTGTGTGTTTGATNITGSYKYISSQVKTNSTIQTSGGPSVIKTVTTSDYTTQDNTGTVTIDANNFITTNLSYTINTTAKSTLYENGIVTDTFSFPFQAALPVSSGTSAYKRIGADSIYFATGLVSIGGSSGAAMPSGAKIKLVNGTLTLTNNGVQSSTMTDQGQTVTTIASVASVTTLQKQ